MSDQPQRSVSTVNRIISTLRELVSALDRRVPQVDRPGELGIARESRMLRREAVAQIEALSRDEADERPYNDELADAIMTDEALPRPRGR
jgi:hypothetical protein